MRSKTDYLASLEPPPSLLRKKGGKKGKKGLSVRISRQLLNRGKAANNPAAQDARR